jgi:hypothetical protein
MLSCPSSLGRFSTRQLAAELMAWGVCAHSKLGAKLLRKGATLLGWNLQVSRPWDGCCHLAWGKREDPEGGPHLRYSGRS